MELKFDLLGVILLVWRTTADLVPKAENLRWTSLDFSTILTWSAPPSQYTYTVLYSADDDDWLESPNCIRVSEGECDLTLQLQPLDRSYSADVKTEPGDEDQSDLDEFPHTFSSSFNPFMESNISAVTFSLQTLDESRVLLNVSDPLTSIHRGSKQLSIRDLLQDRLKYKITYHRATSSGKRDFISDSSVAELSNLDSGESYCFNVAAFIPSRTRTFQQGAGSIQRCTTLKGSPAGLSVGALVGIVFILLTVLIVFIIIFFLCCRNTTKRSRTAQTTSDPV